MDIEEDGPVFLRVFNAPLHLVGFGVAFEVDDIAAVFLQGEDFLDGGMSPFGRLQGTFVATAFDALVPPVVSWIDDPILAQGVCNFSQSIPLQGHIIDTPHHISGLRVDHPKSGIVGIFDISIGRLGQRDARVAFHLVDNFPLLGNVLGVPLVSQPRIKNDGLCFDISDEIVVDVNVPFLVIVHGIAFADLNFLNQPHQRGTV